MSKSNFILMVIVPLLLVLNHSANGKEHGEKPISLTLENSDREKVVYKVLSAIFPEKLIENDKRLADDSRVNRPFKFALAEPVDFDISSSGKWTSLGKGLGRIWRIGFKAEGAISMNLGITKMQLPKGVRLWVYDPGYDHFEGSYSSIDVTQGELWTPIVKSNAIVLEVHVPENSIEPKLAISVANKGYRGFNLGIYDECRGHKDVKCLNDNSLKDQISSVVLYTLDKGTASCTGQLINHKRTDKKPIILSAEHCLDDPLEAINPANFVFYFNFESTACDKRGGHLPNTNVSGANILAQHEASDTLLLELKHPPKDKWKVFSTGWNANEDAAISKEWIGIHHPQGNSKAYSISEFSVESAHLPNDMRSNDKNHWKLSGWKFGITETSSSGSCLLSAIDKKCIGVLTNATKTCRSARQVSYYGKLSSAWSKLKSSLDPNNETAGNLGGALKLYE